MSAQEPDERELRREVERGLLRLDACRAELEYVRSNLAERDQAAAALVVELEQLTRALTASRSEAEALRPMAARYVRMRAVVPAPVRRSIARLYRSVQGTATRVGR